MSDQNDELKKYAPLINPEQLKSFRIPPLPPSIIQSSGNFSSELEKLLGATRRAKEEEVEREHRIIDLLNELVGLSKENPRVQQHIQTLLQGSTIQNMQNIQPGATGHQIITNNNGIQTEDMLRLLEAMRELSDVLEPQRATEVKEAIDDLQDEVQSPEAKPGRIKASLTYLKSLFNDIVVDPTKTIAKKQFTQYAQEKAPEIIQNIDDLIKTMN